MTTYHPIGQITDLAQLVELPDGTLLRWLSVPGDESSAAVAYLRRTETERPGELGGVTTSELWISPGNGWEPEGVDVLVLPVEVVLLGETHQLDSIPEMARLIPQLPSMEVPAWPTLESGVLTSGGTYPRDEALKAAARLYQGKAGPAIAEMVIETAELLMVWLTSGDDPASLATAQVEQSVTDKTQIPGYFAGGPQDSQR